MGGQGVVGLSPKRPKKGQADQAGLAFLVKAIRQADNWTVILNRLNWWS
jgi:hypothetical protein